MNYEKIHIGSIGNKEADYIGIDSQKYDGTDIVHDLNIYPFPIPSDSADIVICSYIVEKVDNLDAFINEIYRISKNNAKINIVAPYYTHIKAHAELDAIRRINEWSFARYSKKYRDQYKLNQNILCDFDSIQLSYRWSPEWNARSEEVKEFARVHYWNVIEDMMVSLKVIKTV